MPIYIFSCEQGHTEEKWRNKPYQRARKFRCAKCGLWMRRDIQAEHGTKRKELHLGDNDPISHLSSKRSFKHKWVENLTPEPVLIKSREQYMRLLEKTHSREKGA